MVEIKELSGSTIVEIEEVTMKDAKLLEEFFKTGLEDEDRGVTEEVVDFV